ncbi:MAG: enoyl-CoA hydratase/isomerase family protein [Acidimicrobiia bacterium]
MELHEYKDRFKCVHVERDDDGVLLVQLRNRGRSLVWGGLPHKELPELFAMIASDRDNRVMVLTGSGEDFISLGEPGAPNPLAEGRIRPESWEQIIHEGNRLVHQLLEIDVPIICALNGPVVAHSELAVLCDIVIAAEHAYFQDAPHFPGGLVPGDSMQIVWPMLLGPNRGRYFLLTGEKIGAAEAKQLGIVGEVLPAAEVLPRAMALAHELAQRNPILLRHTRHVLVRPWKKAMAEDLHLGLSLEAIASLSARTLGGGGA